MLPDLLNELARKQGRSEGFARHAEIHLKLERIWDSVPRVGDKFIAHEDADLKLVESIWWNPDGSVDVYVEDLDTDEVADEEGLVIEELFEAGWEIDWDMMPRP